MANDPLALAPQPDAPSEEDYQAFVAALSESARGRAFLAEYARRCRSADSEMLLSSVQRLEGLVRSQSEAPPATSVGDDLRGMLEAIRGVQAELDASTLAMQVAKLASLIEVVEQRIETLVTPAAVAAPAPQETPRDAPAPTPAEEIAAPEAALPQDEPVAEAAPLDGPADADTVFDVEAGTETLAETETSEASAFEADLAPDAQPAAGPEPAVAFEPASESLDAEPTEAPSEPEAVVAEPPPAAQAAEAEPDASPAMPAVSWDDGAVPADPTPAVDSPPPGLAIAALVETLAAASDDEEPPPQAHVIKAGDMPPSEPFAGEDFSATPRARVLPPPVDPLADIKALSEEERIALFT